MNKAVPADAKWTHNEEIKQAIPTLAGTIASTLADSALDRFAEDDQQFLKFHGIYQQDDRDLRKTGKKFIMMIRGRIPGGVMSPKQWQVFDDLCDQHGDHTLRITTRQSIQFHGVVKSKLAAVVKGINESLLSTLAACGDVNRNVLAPPTPAYTPAREEVFADCVTVADALRPKTRAYHAIWLEGVQLDLNAPENREFVDPLYGPTYLPRKFKVAFVIPPLNDLDVLTNDLGLIAVVEGDRVVGYNLAVGGGMGRSHGNEQTYPKMADVLGFIPQAKLVDVAKAVLTIHRDFGDRADRKHARLKYVVQERGVDWTRQQVEERAGIKLEPARPYQFTKQGDLYGWHKQVDGRWFLGLWVPSGRVKDTPERRLKTALRQIANRFPVEFRLTANQNVIIANVSEAERAGIQAVLAEHGVRTEDQASALHRVALSCPAMPTCGLALAESERYLPGLLDRIEGICAELGLGGQEIIIRMTGCPNGCARPYAAEIGFVGKAPGRYQIWLGGNEASTRLNRLWKDNVKDPELDVEMRGVLGRYAKERQANEAFGDWVARVLWSESAVAA
ncbi:MAG: NADPH-dependent assimilatory sulfite reductase hemoprotein subunit [Verrucomicrobiales bacterium]|nr:NADPH-dependent assimilatory sulfite reductase hemoprotein subunit [Verrucomicrobiales bacterium]